MPRMLGFCGGGGGGGYGSKNRNSKMACPGKWKHGPLQFEPLPNGQGGWEGRGGGGGRRSGCHGCLQQILRGWAGGQVLAVL